MASEPGNTPAPPAQSQGDPFAALGLPRSFDLTPAQVQQAYLRASVAAHPDRAGRSTQEQAHAQLAAARLNGARQILDDPERRAGALLELLGGSSKEADRSLPPGFLVEVMELRERIQAPAGPSDQGAIRQLRDDVTARRAQTLAQVRALFASALGTGPAPGELRAIRTHLNALRYLERMIEQLDDRAHD
jgi:molecular chaperone HscB